MDPEESGFDPSRGTNRGKYGVWTGSGMGRNLSYMVRMV